MKKILMGLFFVFMTFCSFGQIRTMSEYREKKISFYCEDDYSKVVKNLDNELALLEAHKAEYLNEVFMSIKNVLLVDKLFFSLENNELPKEKKDYFSEIFLSQEEECEALMKGRSYEEISGDFLLSLGDLKCQMPFIISIPRSIPKLTKSRELYDNAVKNNPYSCPALISQALWFEYSPGISGGSHKKALKIIQQAEKAATIKSDLYFALMFKGLILNSLKQYDDSYKTFKTAHDLYPDETFTRIMEQNLDIELDF